MDWDILITGGTVIDGSGAPGIGADIGVRDGRIEAVGPTGSIAGWGDGTSVSAARTIDATGRVVSPGFIDPHNHGEIALLGGDGQYAGLLQGVTTTMTAPDGFGWAPLSPTRSKELWRSTIFAYGPAEVAGIDFDWPTPDAYLEIFRDRSPLNVVPMAPHLAIRFGALGWAPRLAEPDELDAMRRSMRAWMDAGALGLNVGLDYQPSIWSDTEELVELGRIAAEYGGVYAAHQRFIIRQELGAYHETIEIGRRLGIPVMVSHAYVNDDVEALVDEAAATCDIALESYLYPAGSTHLIYDVAAEDAVGGPDEIQARSARDPVYRARVVAALVAGIERGVAAGARAWFAATRTGRFIGETVPGIAARLGQSLAETVEMLVRDELPDAVLVYHRGATEEQWAPTTRRTMLHPRTLIASDAVAWGSQPHPRGSGCFVRVFRHAVRELGVVSLEMAVHKMTGYTATRYRLRDRGVIREGLAADLVVFDPATVADRATWEQPRLDPIGIDAVIVNGRVAVAGGVVTDGTAGRVLRPLLDRT